MLKFEVIEDGNALRVSAEEANEFSEYIREHTEDALTSYTPNSDQAFIEMTESYWANGWGVCTADALGELSECLVIAEGMYYEDDGAITLQGKVWTNIHNYQIVNPLDEILENGHVDFRLWDDFVDGKSFCDGVK